MSPTVTSLPPFSSLVSGECPSALWQCCRCLRYLFKSQYRPLMQAFNQTPSSGFSPSTSSHPPQSLTIQSTLPQFSCGDAVVDAADVLPTSRQSTSTALPLPAHLVLSSSKAVRLVEDLRQVLSCSPPGSACPHFLLWLRPTSTSSGRAKGWGRDRGSLALLGLLVLVLCISGPRSWLPVTWCHPSCLPHITHVSLGFAAEAVCKQNPAEQQVQG